MWVLCGEVCSPVSKRNGKEALGSAYRWRQGTPSVAHTRRTRGRGRAWWVARGAFQGLRIAGGSPGRQRAAVREKREKKKKMSADLSAGVRQRHSATPRRSHFSFLFIPTLRFPSALRRTGRHLHAHLGACGGAAWARPRSHRLRRAHVAPGRPGRPSAEGRPARPGRLGRRARPGRPRPRPPGRPGPIAQDGQRRGRGGV